MTHCCEINKNSWIIFLHSWYKTIWEIFRFHLRKIDTHTHTLIYICHSREFCTLRCHALLNPHTHMQKSTQLYARKYFFSLLLNSFIDRRTVNEWEIECGSLVCCTQTDDYSNENISLHFYCYKVFFRFSSCSSANIELNWWFQTVSLTLNGFIFRACARLWDDSSKKIFFGCDFYDFFLMTVLVDWPCRLI